ncbi:MAG: maltotransferase domain-containing protein, partial [Ilumatobacteraceae bacterium]
EGDVLTEIDLAVGSQLATELAASAADPVRAELTELAAGLVDAGRTLRSRADEALTDRVAEVFAAADPRRFATETDPFPVRVDRERARFSSWYELFPRSAAPDPGRHGTFDDVIARLPYVRDMGFDVLYLPPIHPIGVSHRKGPDNTAHAGADEPGSPWAIGNAGGGHTAIHPELGTLADLHRLVGAAHDHGLEIALDIAFQCSPDHPWVTEHPEWFTRRPDGTIQYAENPPKKYQDIYPLNFETEDPEGLWTALRDVFQYWIDQGVRIFRVDNPHTKAFEFWQWCFDDITSRHPDVITLSEAFTRPKVMAELARVGFTQSYTYFAWRDEKWEIEQYYTELFHTELVDFLRPNSWPTTPDILTPFLQLGGRPAFVQKLVLAATLTANYGIYGPAFELMLDEARPGAEEYRANEKYEIHHWDLDQPHSLAELIGRVNAIRHAHPALQQDRTFRLHHVDNDQLTAYSKRVGDDVILTIVNLDVDWRQSGTTWLDLDELGLPDGATFEVHDLLGGATYEWEGPDNYVELDPHVCPAHIFSIRSTRPRPQGATT